MANLEVDPELSVLLAIEAVETTRSSDGTVLPEAEEALHRAVVASRLELEVPGVGDSSPGAPAGVFVTEGPEDSGMIDIRDGETGESVLSFQGHDGDVNDVAFSPDGSRLASTGDDGTLKVWDPSTGRLLSSAVGRRRRVGALRSAPTVRSSPQPGTATGREIVRVLDLSTDRVVSTVPCAGAIDTALSPDGKRLAVASGGCREKRWRRVRREDRARKCSNWRGPTVARIRVPGGCPGVRTADTSPRAARTPRACGMRKRERLRHTLLGHSGIRPQRRLEPGFLSPGHGRFGRHREGMGDRREGVRELWSLSAQETRSGIVGVAFSPMGPG